MKVSDEAILRVLGKIRGSPERLVSLGKNKRKSNEIDD